MNIFKKLFCFRNGDYVFTVKTNEEDYESIPKDIIEKLRNDSDELEEIKKLEKCKKILYDIKGKSIGESIFIIEKSNTFYTGNYNIDQNSLDFLVANIKDNIKTLERN